MKNSVIFTIVTILFLHFFSCQSTKTITLIGNSYDEKTNKTILTLIPYGNIQIPGKWKKANYNEISRQHFFQNENGKSIAITKNPINKYPFFKENLSNKDLVNDFVKWDLEYWKTKGIETKILSDESDKGYIIWEAKNEKSKSTTIFLFGLKNSLAYNFSAELENWNENDVKVFLISLYENN
ncbi:hypothetical protein SDC9_00569 [bioreactor metagenome]|uniref:PsbP C-terminal domain-containing protein n=1 Tax=bioreactor metagenome TaxID=1076179 RepID=A0A644SNA7_9ZZZZ